MFMLVTLTELGQEAEGVVVSECLDCVDFLLTWKDGPNVNVITGVPIPDIGVNM